MYIYIYVYIDYMTVYIYMYIYMIPVYIYICIYINTFTDTGAILGIYEILGNLDKSCSKLLLLDD